VSNRRSSITRGLRRTGRWIASFSRLFLALAFLALLWGATVLYVEDARRGAQEGREADWRDAIELIAEPVHGFLEAGRTEAEGLAGRIAGGTNPGTAAAAHLRSSPLFATDVIVFESDRVETATGAFSRLAGRPTPPTPCNELGIVDAEGASTMDGLLEAAASGPAGRSVLVPGDCRKAYTAFAAPTGRFTVVVLTDAVQPFVSVPRTALTDRAQGSRFLLVDPDTTLTEVRCPQGCELGHPVEASAEVRLRTPYSEDPEGGPPILDWVSVSSRIKGLIQQGDDGDANFVSAITAAGADGWRLVIEQPANVFAERDPNALGRDGAGFLGTIRSLSGRFTLPALLVAAFGLVFIVLAAFDLRRRRAHRRAEVAKNAFFSVAGHELRTPLTSIKGFLETLAARWDDVTDDQKKMLIDRMLPQARRLDRLVERLLTASSIQAETHTHPQVAPLHVRDVIEEVAERYRLESPLHEFVVKVQRNLPEAQADHRALEQILQHLVDNAVKYSPSGGRVGIGARLVRRGVEIAIEDEGVGLPSDAGRIFDALVQGESVTKRVHDEGGMGLGLFIVRTLVTEMGGTVRAERRTPQGSRFVVTLKTLRTTTKAPVATAG
jgi:signal transduction histidine kinase